MTTLMFWNLFTVAREVLAGDTEHWEQQVAVVRRHAPDILCVAEGWEWDRDGNALFERAKQDFGYSQGVLHVAKSGCHMAIFWKDGIALLEHQSQPQEKAWWHGYHHVLLDVPGQPQPLTVLGTHLNPFDPTLRRIEASWLPTVLRPEEHHGILVMDANTVPPGDPEPAFALSTHPSREEPADRTPLQRLADAGLVDIGADQGDRQPTTGHFPARHGVVDRTMRLDQAWATPSLAITGYEVIRDPETDVASDHRPVWVEF